MAPAECPDCSREVPAQAAVCPHCGCPVAGGPGGPPELRARRGRQRAIGIGAGLGGVALALLVIGALKSPAGLLIWYASMMLMSLSYYLTAGRRERKRAAGIIVLLVAVAVGALVVGVLRDPMGLVIWLASLIDGVSNLWRGG